MKLTYEQARDMSIWKWKNFKTSSPLHSDWLLYYRENKMEFKVVPMADCGFCEYFGKSEIDRERCPLRWNNPRMESNMREPCGHWKCSRNFWHWIYWEHADDKEKMRYWANKMLAEIMETPEHEVK